MPKSQMEYLIIYNNNMKKNRQFSHQRPFICQRVTNSHCLNTFTRRLSVTLSGNEGHMHDGVCSFEDAQKNEVWVTIRADGT